MLAPMKAARFALFLLAIAAVGAAPTPAADPAQATIVFVRPGSGGKFVEVGVALVENGAPRAIATLRSNGRATVKVPAGRQRFVLYTLQPHDLFGDAIEQYVEVDLAGGRCYYVRIAFNVEKAVAEGVASVGGGVGVYASETARRLPSFMLIPFKRNTADREHSLTSPALVRWVDRCVEQG